MPSLAPVCTGMDPLQQWNGEAEVFSHLLHAGQYESAVALAHACWGGAALTSALERALGSLAARCARLQMQEEGEERARTGVLRGSMLEGTGSFHRSTEREEKAALILLSC